MHHRHRQGRVAALGIAVIVATTVAACGGGSSPSSTTSTTSSTAAAARRPTAGGGGSASTSLVACLRKNGVTLPTGTFPGRRLGATGGAGPFGAGRRPSGATGRRGFPAAGGFFRGATGARGAARAFANNPKLAKAFAKCRGLIGPAGGGFQRFGATGAGGAAGFLSSPAVHAQVTRFVACMRKNGVKLPTPNLSGTGTIFPGVNQASTAFRTAYTTCRALISFLPGNRGGAPATG
ncbi:MAG TPA: hypothetical protein VHX66_14405 [Solirubrobacteraceae bacterium]|jgi:hypothetical protein|nr:hypothetical protein [Solirubrobacteraceae bacterium]